MKDLSTEASGTGTGTGRSWMFDVMKRKYSSVLGSLWLVASDPQISQMDADLTDRKGGLR